MPTINEELRALGIPTDRVELVKRNVELKAKLIRRGTALLSLQDAWHKGFEHTSTSETCLEPICAGIREIIKGTAP